MAQFHIQAGNLKHLKLIFNPDESTRPTKSIVRGSFFDTLGSEIVDSVFIEAFGGCGSMGASKPDGPRSISGTHIVEEENRVSQVVF